MSQKSLLSLSLSLSLLLVVTCKGYDSYDYLDGKFITKDIMPVDLLAPSDKSTSSISPKLTWTKRSGANKYLVEMSTSANFATLVLSKTTTDATYTLVNSDLIGITTLDAFSYYWRVTAQYSDQKVVSGSFIFHVLDDAIVYVNGSSTASEQVGNKSAPLKSIQAGIESANSRRNGVSSVAMAVQIAGGTYIEEVNLRPGISILGGYESSLWNRNIGVYATNINAPTDFAIRGNTAITPAFRATTVVDGLTPKGGSGGTNYGIYLVSASPTISNNTINGGSGGVGSNNYGIYNIAASSPMILSNTITGSSGGGGGAIGNVGIYNISSSPTISNNTITGGSGGTSTGIYNDNSHPTILNNMITGGSGTGTSRGIMNYNISGPTISNNTINGGTSGGPIYGILLNSASVLTVTIKNNIIFTSTGTGFCLYEATASDDPSLFQNNDLFGCAQRYVDHVGFGGNCPSDGTRNCYNLAADLNDITKTTQGAPGTADGNEIIDNAANQLFVDIDGADNNIATVADNNWHLKDPVGTTICNVLYGGLNLAPSLTTDKDVITRTPILPSLAPCSGNVTNTGATGWSMGAYEK